MGEHFVDNETVRVDFPDGAWIEVKEELSQADQDYLLDQMAHAEAAGKEAKMTFSLGKLALLERSIVAWSFPEPVSKENISRLRLRYRQKVLAEVDRLNTLAGEFIRKNL